MKTESKTVKPHHQYKLRHTSNTICFAMASSQLILRDTSLEYNKDTRQLNTRKVNTSTPGLKTKLINDNCRNRIKDSLSKYLSKEKFVYNYIGTSQSREVRENYCPNKHTLSFKLHYLDYNSWILKYEVNLSLSQL